jgi:hypothetical protein
MSGASSAIKSGTVKESDDLSRTAHEAGERWSGWFVGQSDGSLIEQYIHHKKRIALCYAPDIGRLHDTQEGLIFEALDGRGASNGGRSIARYVEPTDFTGRREQPLMLAKNVQSVHGPNGVIPSLIWVQRFNFVDFGGGEPPFAFDFFHKRQKLGLEFPNREVMIGTRLYAIPTRERNADQIEAATARVDNATDASGDYAREGLTQDCYRKILASLRITLRHDIIGFSLLPLTKGSLNHLHLGFGPFD